MKPLRDNFMSRFLFYLGEHAGLWVLKTPDLFWHLGSDGIGHMPALIR